MVNNLNTMVKIVAGMGAIESCAAICNYLNDTEQAATCFGLCTLIGFEQFWHIFERANIDPIWACQLTTACPVVQSPAGKISSTVIHPASGPAGTTFNFTISFTVSNDTGVGELAYVVYFPSGQSKIVSATYFEDYQPGDYTVVLSFPTNTTYPDGSYLVIIEFCAGVCYSSSPNAVLLSATESTLTMLST